MIIIVGLVILVAAVAGVASTAAARMLSHFPVLGYDVTGSAGRCSSTASWPWPSPCSG
jgi:hypothetical protein